MASSGALVQPDSGQLTDSEYLWRQLMQVVGRDQGLGDWGSAVNHVSFADDSTYAHTIENQGSGGHLNVPGLFQVKDTGVTVAAGDVTGNWNVGGAFSVGLTSHLVGAVTADNDLLVKGNATVQGNTALGNANTDTITAIAVATFRNAANTATQLLVDPGNNRVVVGSGTALGSDTTPNLQVVGRLYVAPETANDFALEVRRSSAATVGFDLGVTSTNDFVFKDDSGTETFRIGDVASTYQAKVTGDFNVTDDTVLAGDLTVGGLFTSNGTFAINGDLTFTGASRKILADMSTNLLAFQTSTASGNTNLKAIPNNSSGFSVFNFYDKSTADGHGMQIGCFTTEGRINAFNAGAGTNIPMTFYAAGAERMRITAAGEVTSPDIASPTINGQLTARAVCKGYVEGSIAAGVLTTNQSYNLTSASRTSAGLFVVTWDKDFAAATYPLSVAFGAAADLVWRFTAKAAGTSTLQFSTTAGVATDPTWFSVMAFGTLS